MNGKHIVTAAQMLKAKYPHERVQLWVELEGHETRYVASVGGIGRTDQVFEFGTGPISVVEKLIAKVGDRDPDALRQQRIARLRKELEELEAQGMAKLVEECCEPKTEVTA